MWNVTKEVKEKFQTCNLLPIYESDDDWEYAIQEAKEEGEDLEAILKEELEEVKDQLLQVLPSRFIPYIENGTLNQPTLPKKVREDYLSWMAAMDKEFEQVLDAAYENTKQAILDLPLAVQEVFEESLHDAMIERIKRKESTLHLYLNTDGGFAKKSYIHLVFRGIISEQCDQDLQLGQYYIYDELQKREDGFAFRVLFESPDMEWTIVVKEIDAAYYYRPSAYVMLRDEEKLDETIVEEYVAQLYPEQRYWFITPEVICPIQIVAGKMELENGKIDFEGNNFIVTVKDVQFTYDLSEYNPIEFIFTDVYEDPYAKFEEALPAEQLETAALGDDLELQVRAWNTMVANPIELASIINSVLEKVVITDENEMMLTVFIAHFYSEGILKETIVQKYREFINL